MELICSCRHCSTSRRRLPLHSLLLPVMHIIAVTWHGKYKYGLRAVPILHIRTYVYRNCEARRVPLPKPHWNYSLLFIRATIQLLLRRSDEGEHWTQDTRHNSLNDPPQANPMGSLVSLTTCPSSVCGQATDKKKKKIGKKLPFDWCNCHVLHHIIRSPCCLSSIKGNLRSTVFSCGNLED